MKTRLPYALFGVLATLVGVAIGHLVAALTNPSASPVLAVGSQVIDLTPTPMKEWAIEQFGTADKAILVGSVMAGVLVLAAVGGLLARKRFWVGAGLLVALVALAGGAAMNRPAAELIDLLPAVAAAIGGVAALWWLDRSMRASQGTAAPTAPSAVVTDHPMARPTDNIRTDNPPENTPGATVRPAGTTRRGVLITTGVLAFAAAVMGTAGRFISAVRTGNVSLTLPAAADPAPAFPVGLDDKVPGITKFRTPTADFYKVDTRLTVPIVDVNDWTLTIDGDVDKELTFTFEDLAAMPLIERDITLTCVSNDVGGFYVGGTRWLGVRLTDLLDLAGVGSTADQIFSTDVDGMTISTPLDLATDGRDAMIAIGMNGESLTRDHGFPARMVVPGLYGFISATKWISKITLTTYAENEAYWTDRKWATDAPIKLSSRIDTPQALSTIDAGDTFIGGVAWAQHQGGVAEVEVRIDGGAWEKATLGPSAGNDYWRQWFVPWKATSGQHSLAVRCLNGDGDAQTAARATTFPDGSSGIQEILVSVS